MYVFIQIIDIIRIPNAASVYFVGVNRELFYNMTTTCIYCLRSYCKFVLNLHSACEIQNL